MDATHVFAISGVVALVLLFKLWRRENYTKSEGKLVPEAAGGLPFIGHLHLLDPKKNLARTLGEMGDKYGPVYAVRLGMRPTVIIANQDAFKDCFTTNDKIIASRPPSVQAEIVGYNYSSFGFAPYGPYWRKMRKLAMVELLSNHRTKMMNYVQISEVNHLVKTLYHQSKTSEKVNLSRWIEHTAFNIITRMVAGKRYFDESNDGDDQKGGRPIGDIIKEFMFATGALVPGDLIPFLKWWDVTGTVKTMKRVTKEVDVIIDRWIEEHKSKKVENETMKDFIDVMLTVIADEESMGLSRETIIKGATSALILAGSDTTAITTIWTLASLLSNRKALEQCQEELDLKVGKDRCVEVSDIEKLDYLNATTKETLRLYPPGPLGVPRLVAEDCYISGYYVPKGTRIFTNFWKLHRDPNVWENPEEFKPERFLTNKSHLDVTGQNFEYLPFSGGRRSCPGINLAMQVLHLTVARVVQAFDMKEPVNEPVSLKEAPAIVWPKETPLVAVLTPRLAPEFYDRD